MKKLLIFFLFLILLVGGTVLYARYIEPAMLRTQYVDVKNGPKLRVVFFSDTHFGKDYAQENIARIVSKINDQNPDIVVFGGDFFDDYHRDFSMLDLAYIKTQLAAIQGTKFAVWGNHDYGGGAESIYEDVLNEGGFQVLTNESLYLAAYDLTIVGYDELYYGSRDTDLQQLSTGTYNLLLAHEPDMALKLVTDTPGMLLGGHSHGGQVTIPFYGPYILPDGAKQFSKGLYSTEETGSLNEVFVTCGIGTSIYPIRFMNMPEVVTMDFGKGS